MPSQARIDAGRRNGMLANESPNFLNPLENPTTNSGNRKTNSKPTSSTTWLPPAGASTASRRSNPKPSTSAKPAWITPENSKRSSKSSRNQPEPTRIAIAFEKEMNESKTWANLSRYEARYFRELRQGAAELRRVQKGRRDAEADEVAEAANEEINSESEPICKNEGNEPALSLKTLQNTILPNEGNEVARSLFAILQNEGNGNTAHLDSLQLSTRHYRRSRKDSAHQPRQFSGAHSRASIPPCSVVLVSGPNLNPTSPIELQSGPKHTQYVDRCLLAGRTSVSVHEAPIPL